MKNIILLMYHGMGHFNACFKIAKMLKPRYNVVFAGVEFFKDYIEMQGFMFYPLKTVPFGMGFERWVNKQKKSKYSYLLSVKDRWTDALYENREAELSRMLADVPPDYILIDSYQSTDFIVLYSYLESHSVKVCFIQTMMSTVIRENYPPINSLVLPTDKNGIKEAIRKFRRNKTKKKIAQRLLYMGMSDDMIISRRLRRNKVPTHFHSGEASLRGIAFSCVQEFILAPEEFDFEQHVRTEFRHYVGFMPDLDRLEIADTEYFKIDSDIRRMLKGTNGSLVYCSFGSVKMKDAFAVRAFLQRLVEVTRDNNCVVIISVNSILKQHEEFPNTPANVYFLNASPQLEILKRADVFITHGGLNSIKESIYSGVPMLVYPLHSDTDTMGNSTRVIHHKLGLRGDLLHDTEEDIGKKIEELIANEAYKKNIQALRAVDETYVERFMELFDNLKSMTRSGNFKP